MTADLAHHARQLRWDAWANRETLASLRRTGAPAAVRWLAHIAGAELLWLGRLTGEPSEVAVWPELALDEVADHLSRLESAWPRYLASMTDEELEEPVGYRNSRGEFWTSGVGDILTHVVTHSAYHRGQIAASVRAAGGESAYTDFIHAVRKGLIE
ncbi:MAG TPA: DinB family protein [Gemmatimonadales bacterium]|nr:DinB family protein [Gemmatimonadales bacterium]